MVVYNTYKIIEPQKSMMTLTGIWPEKSPTFYYHVRSFFSFLFGGGLTTMMIIEIIYSLKNFTKLSEILYVAAVMISFMVKFICFKLKANIFFVIMDQITDPQLNCTKFNHFVSYAWRISSGLTTLYRFVVISTCITFGILPFIENKPLPFPFPFFHTGFMRYVAFTFQYISINISAWNNAGFDVLSAGFMLIAGAQLDVLKCCIQQIINENDEDGREDKFRQCCIHHNKIIDFIRNIEKLFSLGLLAQFSASIVCICNTGFYFMLISWKSAQFFTLVLYLIALFSQISMYCWFGNEIILKSKEVGDACYNSNWYELSPKLNKYVFLIMERSKRPLVISVYKLSVLSLTALTSIIQWSYSYYTVLRRLYTDKL